ncbi:MAG: TonB-dependent receptor [Desulfobulbaceae bacterium]|nr:TonB-dependent receptor [Desulfobulbaceae bacterium]
MRHLLILLAILLLVRPATAEKAKPMLDEIVVTASRVGQKLSDTPVTISVIDEKEIEKVKYRNPDEILRRIPGVYTHDFGGESELSSIRIPTHFTNPYTLLLIDGVPTSSYGSGSSGNFGELNSDNIARIEVVKGPSSALYGSNAIGGVINVITKNPSPQPEVKVWGELGEDDQWRSGVSGSGSNDKLSFNFFLNRINSDNWRQQADVDKKAGNVKLQYLPTEQGLLTFKLDYIDYDNETPGSINEDDFLADWQQSYQTFAYKKLKKITPLVSYTHYLENAEFKTTLLLRDIDEEGIPQYAIREQRRGQYVGQYSESDTRDIDGQFLYTRDFDKLRSKIILGVDAERGSIDAQQYDLDVTYDSALNKYTGYTNVGIDDDFDITTKIYAPYLQFELSPFEKLRLTAGGRYDKVNYDVDSRVDASKSGDKDFSRFSPKFGAVYQFSPTLNTYMNISEGFVVPTTSQLLTSSWANIDLDPEKSTNYEVGVRSSLLDRQIDLDVALYTMDIKDKIIASDITSRLKKYVNAGETSQKGVEVMARYSPFDFASLSLAYTYAKNKFEEYSPGTEDFEGNYLPRSPKHRLNLRLNVRPVANMDVEFEMDEISSQYANDANTAKYSRPTLFNMRVKYDWREWSIWASLENLTDKEYASYVSYSASDDTSKLFSGKPRTLFAGLSYTWQGGK